MFQTATTQGFATPLVAAYAANPPESSLFFQEIISVLSGFSQSIVFNENLEKAHEQTIYLDKDSLVRVCETLQNQFGFSFLLDICGADYPEREKRFDVVYHLHNDKQNHRVRLKTSLGENETIPSLCSLWAGANWFERECFDMFGVKFDGHPDMRRILCHKDFVGHPLRKDYPADFIQPMTGEPIEHVFEHDRQRLMENTDEDWMWVNVGPAHPATHGTLRFMAVIDGGETIKAVDTEIGYLHRCFEKMCENHNYNQIIPYTDRLNYCSAPMNNNAFAATIEKMLGVHVPPKATMMRMILDEFSRIIDHYVCIGTNAVDLGAITGFFYMFQERENVYGLFEKLCGARLTVSLTRIGGLGYDLPNGWVEEAKTVIASIEKTHAEIESLLTSNRIFVQRTRGAGPISKEMAVQYGYTGPCLRATGYEHDLRKISPYYFYNSVDFDVPVGSKGDTYDRYLVRMEEVRQSIRILKWCLANLPEGPIAITDTQIVLPPKSEVYGNIEGLMNHFMLVINGVKVPKGEAYHSIEAANGELGFYVVSDGSGVPYRVKCRAPCFALMSSMVHMCTGIKLADAIAALGSINIIAGELDR
jgi:NADH-quinone oxidoreductase subunit C/D